MASKYLIPAYPKGSICPPHGPKTTDSSLDITECFYDTIQGEGSTIGYPAIFLRLQGCTLDCQWCDTVWQKGWRFTFDEIFRLMRINNIVEKLAEGHRLILTGGSPLRQQDSLIKFLKLFCFNFGFLPVIEIENECTVLPNPEMLSFVDVWNNSPKLSSSGMKSGVRIKPNVLKLLSGIAASWFKFVVSCEEDWQEIQMDFLDPGYIRKDQIILMPLGATLEELKLNESIIATMAIEHGVRFSTRMQLILGVP